MRFIDLIELRRIGAEMLLRNTHINILQNNDFNWKMYSYNLYKKFLIDIDEYSIHKRRFSYLTRITILLCHQSVAYL